MIRKMYGQIDAPVDLVRSIFIDPENWPLWLPGVEEVTVLSRSEKGFLVDVGGRYLGRQMHGEMECIIQPDGLRQRQLSGWLKQWDTLWRFLTPPDGRGTTLACEVEMNLGLLGVFTPSRMVHSFVDRVFADTREQVDRRTRELQTEKRAIPEHLAAEVTRLLRVYETPSGLEVWIGERRYLLPSSE
jgi:hypothetical protein